MNEYRGACAEIDGSCKLSPKPVHVARQPFIGPLGQRGRMGYLLHLNFLYLTELTSDEGRGSWMTFFPKGERLRRCLAVRNLTSREKK